MLYISYEILFYYGHRRLDVFRSHKRWQPLLPFLMDHVLVEIDPDIEDTYAGSTQVGRSNSFSSVPIPIEAKLRSLCVKLLYEVCRIQTLSVQDLSKSLLSYYVFVISFFLTQKYLMMISSIISSIWLNKRSICMMKLSIIP